MSRTPQENYLSDILQCWCIPMASSQEKLENLRLPPANLVNFLIEPDGDTLAENIFLFHNGQDIDASVMDFLRQELPLTRRFTMREYNGTILLITNIKAAPEDEAAKRYEAITLAEHIQNLLKNEIGISVSIGISRTHDSLNEMGLALIEAVTALQDKYFRGDGCIVHVDDMCSMAISRNSAELTAFIEAANAQGAEAALSAFYTVIRTRMRQDIILVRSLFVNLLVQVYQFLFDLPSPDEADDLEPIHELCKKIDLCPSPDEIFQMVSRYITASIEQLRRRRFKRHEVLVDRAKNFISDNAHRGIGVADVAEHIGVSQSYFSNIFKQYTGQSFVQYLTAYRIQRAKELLASPDMKIAEVALAVGFNDTKYFSNIFKKQAGVTPSEYRQSLQN